MDERRLDPHTYNGFSAPVGQRHEPAEAARPPRTRNGGRIAGLLAACLLIGGVAGLGARALWEHGREPPREPAAQAAQPLAPAPLETPAPSPPAQAAPAAPLAASPSPSPVAGPAFPCTGALRPSERMVCDDPVLSGLDRRLNSAFAAAVRAGAPRAQLRAEQDQWVFRRETAARRSREDLAAYYRSRIAELEALARRTQ